MIDLLRPAAGFALMLVPLLRRQERRTIVRLTDAGANTRERAVTLERTGRLGRFVHRRLEHAQVLVAAGNDRYYLNAPAYTGFRRRRRRRAMLVLAILLIGIAVVYLRGEIS